MRNLIKNIIFEEVNQNDFDINILSFLRRRYSIKDIKIGDVDDNPITLKRVIFNVGDEVYEINDYRNKKQNINTIIELLDDAGIINFNWGETGSYDKEKQKIVRTIKHFLNTINFQ